MAQNSILLVHHNDIIIIITISMTEIPHYTQTGSKKMNGLVYGNYFTLKDFLNSRLRESVHGLTYLDNLNG